jgi:hypothetical protein
VQHEWIGVAAEFGDDERQRCAIRPATKATSRDSRSRFETRTQHFAALAEAPATASRAIDEYLAVLDDAAFGAATQVVPKFISPADPAARWTGAYGGAHRTSSSQQQLAIRMARMAIATHPAWPVLVTIRF